MVKNGDIPLSFFTENSKAFQRQSIKAAAEEIYNSLVSEFRDTISLGKIPSWSDDTWVELQPIIDIVTGQKLIFNEVTEQVTRIHYDTYKQCCHKTIQEHKFLIPCMTMYNPLTLNKSWVTEYEGENNVWEGVDTLYVNRHISPEWRYSDSDLPNECPEIIEKLLVHLFPLEECREYALNWIRNSILKERNGTYLVLNANKGVGKGLLVTLLKHLVGPQNFSKAPRGFLTSQFNAFLDDKRLIQIDEHRINTPDKIDMIKDYINPEQNVEKKGVDADGIVTTTNSFIICNNRETDIKIEQDDRRFSVMDMGDINLKEVWPLEEIVMLDHIGEYPEIVEQFGRWLVSRPEGKWDIETPWKGDKFKHLVEVSLWDWEKFIVDKILFNTEDLYFEYTTLQMEYKQQRSSSKSTLSIDRVRAFLNEYKIEGELLGTITRVEKAWRLVPCAKYIPQELIEEEMDDIL